MFRSNDRYKFDVGELVRANDKAPGDYRGGVGEVVSRGPGKCEYSVQFKGDARGLGVLDSWCLDRLQRTAPPVGDSGQILMIGELA